MKWCWREPGQEGFFGLDKVQHILLHLTLSVFIQVIFWNWIFTVIVCEAIGFGTEILETTDLWDRFMKWLGEPEGKTHCISIKDLIVNTIAMIIGIIFLLLLDMRLK